MATPFAAQNLERKQSRAKSPYHGSKDDVKVMIRALVDALSWSLYSRGPNPVIISANPYIGKVRAF